MVPDRATDHIRCSKREKLRNCDISFTWNKSRMMTISESKPFLLNLKNFLFWENPFSYQKIRTISIFTQKFWDPLWRYGEFTLWQNWCHDKIFAKLVVNKDINYALWLASQLYTKSEELAWSCLLRQCSMRCINMLHYEP